MRIFFFLLTVLFLYVGEGRAEDVGCYTFDPSNQRTLEGVLTNVPSGESSSQETTACNVTFPPKCQDSCVAGILQMSKTRFIRSVPHKPYKRVSVRK